MNVQCPLIGRHQAKAKTTEESRLAFEAVFFVELRCARCRSVLAARVAARGPDYAVETALAAYARLPASTRERLVGQRIKRFVSPMLVDERSRKQRG